MIVGATSICEPSVANRSPRGKGVVEHDLAATHQASSVGDWHVTNVIRKRCQTGIIMLFRVSRLAVFGGVKKGFSGRGERGTGSASLGKLIKSRGVHHIY
jgi:hypothetical protein